MVNYEDVQDFYDHGHPMEDDETLDVDVKDTISSRKFKIASSFVVILLLLGCIEICHIIDYFLPSCYVSYLGILVLIPSALSYHYVLTSLEDYWMKRWALRKRETLLLHAAIRKAIWTIDFSPLLPACNPNWLEFTKNNSYDWKTLKDSTSNPQIKKSNSQ